VESKPARSYRDVAGDVLRVAVIDTSNLMGKITAAKVSALKAVFRAEAVRLSRTTGKCPMFNHMSHAGEIMRIHCADASAKDWLKVFVDRLPSSEFGTLKVVQADKLPSLTKCSLFIPDEDIEGIADIQSVLAAQNPTLAVKSWCMLFRESRNQGLLMVLGIPKQDVATLAAEDNRVHFLFSTLRMKIHPREEEGATAPQPAATQMVSAPEETATTSTGES
jgi:hypothetical protein